MELFPGLDAVPAGYGPSAVTIGKFDGMHLGHRAVIAALQAEAAARGLSTAVVTFDRNPLSILSPETCPEPLVSRDQKIELLASSGVDATLELAFDRAFSETPPEDFVRTILVEALGARLVLAGADFRFGHRGGGDVALLRELGARHGFEVVLIDDVVPRDLLGTGRRVSSTWVRELLAEGRVREARTLLGRPPALRSTVVHGEQRGRELGFPTANLAPDIEGFVPVDAVYATWARIDGVRYGAAVSIGNNPTFEGVPQHQVEAHLFDVRADLYGRTIELEFVEHIRPMNRFDSVEALVEQLNADAAIIREILAADPR
jgi:riboflavin kinase/FMN adenylyltransferase